MKRYRSAVTGEYVTEEYAEANPSTTVSEEVEEDKDFMEGFSEKDVQAYINSDTDF